MNQVLAAHPLPNGGSLQIVGGDLTRESVDAIVNAANARLQHGGGVAGAIVRQGGSSIQAESSAWVRERGPVSHDRPAYTSAGKLPCRYVIHAVGPVWGSGNEDAKLVVAVRGSLEVADQLELNSLALPAISTGIFGFPKERAAHVTLVAILDYFVQTPASGLQQVRLTLLDQSTQSAFLQALKAIASE